MNRREFLRGALKFGSVVGFASVAPNAFLKCAQAAVKLEPGLVDDLEPLGFTYAQLLNEYLPKELLMKEFMKRDYCLLSALSKGENWQGGTIKVPFYYEGEGK